MGHSCFEIEETEGVAHVRLSRPDAYNTMIPAFWSELPEIIEAYRTSGEIDYTLKVVVPSIEAYDDFYKRLIARVDLYDVRTVFVMEQMKQTTALPLDYL